MRASAAARDFDRILLAFPAADGYGGVGRLVLGGLASRFDLPVDRVDELLLAFESVALQSVFAEEVTIDATAEPRGLRVRVGRFSSSPTIEPAAMRVLEGLVDEVAEVEDDGGVWVELMVSAEWRSGAE